MKIYFFVFQVIENKGYSFCGLKSLCLLIGHDKANIQISQPTIIWGMLKCTAMPFMVQKYVYMAKLERCVFEKSNSTIIDLFVFIKF